MTDLPGCMAPDDAELWPVAGRLSDINGRYYHVRVSKPMRVRIPIPGSKQRIYIKQIVHENDIVWLYQRFAHGRDFDGDPIAHTRTIDTIDPPDHLMYREVWRLELSINDRVLVLDLPADRYDELDLPDRVFISLAGMLYSRAFLRRLKEKERPGEPDR